MTELFPEMDAAPEAQEVDASAPLAARLRPRRLDDFVGQAHIVGPGSPLRSLIEADRLSSVILWGPPGTGKTSLATIIASATRAHYIEVSAVSAGVADVRKAIAQGRELLKVGRRTILFIDEIHRFNKSQQDALLKAVESGWVVLIGATTENPFFEVNGPLLSRSLMFRLEPLTPEQVRTILDRAVSDADQRCRAGTGRRAEARSTGPHLGLAGGSGATPARPSGCCVSSGRGRQACKSLAPAAVEAASSAASSATTSLATCTTTSSRRSSRACAAPTPTPPSSGWRRCWRRGRTPSSSPAG